MFYVHWTINRHNLSLTVVCLPIPQFYGSHWTHYYFVKNIEYKCKPILILLKTIELPGPFSSILNSDLRRSLIFGGQRLLEHPDSKRISMIWYLTWPTFFIFFILTGGQNLKKVIMKYFLKSSRNDFFVGKILLKYVQYEIYWQIWLTFFYTYPCLRANMRTVLNKSDL